LTAEVFQWKSKRKLPCFCFSTLPVLQKEKIVMKVLLDATTLFCKLKIFHGPSFKQKAKLRKKHHKQTLTNNAKLGTKKY